MKQLWLCRGGWNYIFKRRLIYVIIYGSNFHFSFIFLVFTKKISQIEISRNSLINFFLENNFFFLFLLLLFFVKYNNVKRKSGKCKYSSVHMNLIKLTDNSHLTIFFHCLSSFFNPGKKITFSLSRSQFFCWISSQRVFLRKLTTDVQQLIFLPYASDFIFNVN